MRVVCEPVVRDSFLLHRWKRTSRGGSTAGAALFWNFHILDRGKCCGLSELTGFADPRFKFFHGPPVPQAVIKLCFKGFGVGAHMILLSEDHADDDLFAIMFVSNSAEYESIFYLDYSCGPRLDLDLFYFRFHCSFAASVVAIA